MFDFYPEVNLSREELLAKIKAQMSEKRFQHILGVEKAAVAPEQIAGVGVTSFGNGVVFLDKEGYAIAPGCFSQDYRANSIIEMYQREGTYEKINDIVKGTLFAGEPGPILRWYK